MKKISLLFIVAISIILTSCKSGSDTDIKVITVNNAEELIQALGNDRIIILNNNEGIFWLTEAIEAAVEANFIDKYSNIVYLDENNRYTIPKDYSGILAHDDELCFYNMKNLTIRGANEEKYTKIYISLDYADVLFFSGCTDISLENLELGHYPEEGQCTGGVLGLFECNRVTINNCELFGCGTTGIRAIETKNVTVNNSTIRDCTESNVDILDCENFRFYNCKLISENDILCSDSENISFEKCVVPDIVSGDMSFIECEYFYWMEDEGCWDEDIEKD
jgi:hypothetical protein